MSKSKHTPHDVPPKPRRRILRNEDGTLKQGWRLAVMTAGYLALTVAARLGMSALLRALFTAWNVNAQTVARAPGWAASLYSWQGSAVTLAVDIIAILFVRLACRVRLTPPRGKRPALWWVMGTGVMLLSAVLFLLMDSLRLRWPLSRPHLSIGLVVLWALTLLTTLAEELFTKGVVFDTVNRSRGKVWAVVASMALFFLLNGGYSGSWISGINVALMGALCALLYDRCGLWAPVGFRLGWSFAGVFLLGQGGGDRAVYRLYGVSEALLTGGDAGLVYGLWTTAVLIVLITMNVRNAR